jgi:3-hydroxyacyl-CoA dehydrogenase/enoyl-CoA hydratase/3-hydroxybutyryl-CoA epimerase
MNDRSETGTRGRQDSFETLDYRVADNGVAFIAIDLPGRSVNLLTPELHREIGEVAGRLAEDQAAVGAVLYSAKETFMAGGDLNRIVRYYDMDRSPERAYRESRTFTESLRRLETCGKPVAAAINGAALGGGLEMTLACHHRVVVDEEDILLGLPEVTLGLLPGAGGTQRLPRLIGIEKAAGMILSGKPVNPAEALELGFVDQLCERADLLAKAEQWVLQEGNAEQPWDRRGFRIPGGAKLNDMNVGRLFQLLTARVASKYRHNYPAPIAALRCLFNGTSVNAIDAGLKIETREFSALTRDPVARNIIRTLFINKRQRKFRKEDCNADFVAHCRQAYMDEGARMLAEGVPRALIEHSALDAGMPDGPLAMSGSEAKEPGSPAAPGDIDAGQLRERLLCIQVLAALRFNGEPAPDPVEADLNSVLGWGFPSYTGGVMSYIDTMGWRAFGELCDCLSEDCGERFRIDRDLRRRVEENVRIFAAPD